MNDRELLELAAKAVRASGANIIDSEAGPQIFERYSSDGWECYRLWIPHKDDGDSRRIQVALQISLEFGETKPSVQFPAPYARALKRIPCDDGSGYAQEHDAVEYVLTPSDVERAARYAVLRVAAAAGKAMP